MMYTKNRGFEWDDEKAGRNLLKHSISFSEAATAFQDPDGILADDPAHSQLEPRHWLIGETAFKQMIFAVFTVRAGPHIRIISARPANRKERLMYEQNRRIPL